jgi:DNA-binding transcriptional MerR regulator
MGQPTPPGDNVPLYEGLDPSWNDIVSAFPEDRRNDLAPLLQSRVSEIEKRYEPLKQYEDFAKSGVSPDQVSTALSVYSTIENSPERVYKMLGDYLGVSAKEAKEAVQQVQDADPDEDPRIATMQQQLDTLMKIKVAEHQQNTQQQMVAEQEAALDRELKALQKKYGDFDEEQILMRMQHKGVSAEDAYKEYDAMVSNIRRTRPAPMVLGQGGQIPRNAVDPTKLDSKDTKNLVAQMLAHANQQRNQA